jgi:hypothetical protein
MKIRSSLPPANSSTIDAGTRTRSQSSDGLMRFGTAEA